MATEEEKLVLNLTEHDKNCFFKPKPNLQTSGKSCYQNFLHHIIKFSPKNIRQVYKETVCARSVSETVYKDKLSFIQENDVQSDPTSQASDMGFGSGNHQGAVKMFVLHFSRWPSCFLSLYTDNVVHKSCASQFACACGCLTTKGGFSCPG